MTLESLSVPPFSLLVKWIYETLAHGIEWPRAQQQSVKQFATYCH